MIRIIGVTFLMVLVSMVANAIDYPYSTAEPQKSGWPLTAEERAYVVDKPEHDRRPGREANKHLPHLWPVVPSAGHFGGDSWMKLHEAHVKSVQANAGPIDVLLVGDSITIQWGESWTKHFPDLKAVNIGIGGDKTQNVLWRLDHGGVSGIEPKVIVLMIGNNNMFFTPETGIEAAARGIELCVKNLREKFPQAKIVVAKILPAHTPDHPFYRDIKATNEVLDEFNLNNDPLLQVLDLTQDFVNSDGTLKKDLYTSDNIHLSAAGYSEYASRLKPLMAAMLAGKPLPAQPMKKASAADVTPAPKAATLSIAPKAAAKIILPSRPVLTYPYSPYNEGRMDPQLHGWPLTAAEVAWTAKGEYFRKPGHELQKHLPEMPAGEAITPHSCTPTECQQALQQKVSSFVSTI
jgi:lysophospholipase L1-like esterase